MIIHKGAGPREVPGSSRHAARLHTGKPEHLLHADRQPGGDFTFGLEGDREKALPADHQALRINVNSFFVPRRLKIRTAAIEERSRITL